MMSPSDHPSVFESAPPHILIVEDNTRYAVELLDMLRRWRPTLITGHCEVDIAPNIEKARSHLNDDDIDIYILDLVMPENHESNVEHEDVGKAFVREIASKTNAGIIVHSSLSAETETAALLEAGADDYVQKNSQEEILKSRILALWRRTQLARPNRRNIFVHANRVFLIGDWKFVVGSRNLASTSGEIVKLSQTEHAFLRHICTSENYECDKISFNLYVLGREHSERESRIDNFVYRLRKKLGDSTHFISSDGVYRLLGVREIKQQ